jgi:CARDB
MNTTQTNVRGTLAPLLSIAVIMALFSFAQTFAASSDDFNDNIVNPSKWGDDRLGGGVSYLTETNQRLEYEKVDFTAPSIARPWILTQFPYSADWEIQIDTFNGTSPLLGGNAFGIRILSPHTPSPLTLADGVSAELYSSVPRGGPVRREFASYLSSTAGSDGFADSGDIGATNGAVRIAFDSATKVVTVLYDKDVTDGYQWVEYGSFGIAGAGGANGNTNWGLAEGEQFSAFVYAYSRRLGRISGPLGRIFSGQMFGDNFMETGGVPPNGPPNQPNLTLYQPAGWSDKIVVSNVSGTNTDNGGLLSTDALYLDWSVLNGGGANINASFTVELYVDDMFRDFWIASPPTNVAGEVRVEDYNLGSLSNGTHTLRIKSDATNSVAESNEADNEYTKTITIGTPAPTPTITISSSPAVVNEGGSATFTIFASTVNPSQPVTVNYIVNGKAFYGTDYDVSGIPGQITIPAGASSAAVTLNALTDNRREKKEKVVMTLQPGTGYALPKKKTATVTIANVRQH